MSTKPETSPSGAVPVLGVPDDGLITPVPYEDMPDRLRDELAAKVQRLGYLGGFFSVAAHQPDALLHFSRFTETLKDALGGRLSEVVALAAAATAGNEYELVQHIRLARKLGCPDTWIRAAAYGEDGPDDGTPLNPDERDVRALVQAALRGQPAQAELAAVVARLGEGIAVGVLLLLGRYMAHAMTVRVLGLGPPVALDPPLAPTRNTSSRRTP